MKTLALIGALLVAAAGAAALPGGPEQEPESLAGGFSTKDGRIVDGRGRTVVLRGFNLIPVWPESPGSTWDGAEYRRIRRGGFNVVRMYLHWSTLEPRRGRLARRHLRTLDTAVARARVAGLRVVLVPIGLFGGDLFVPRWARTPAGAMAAVERSGLPYVRAVAARYAGERAVVAIDPVNEPPTHPPDQDRILRMYRPMIDAVREVAPGKLVMFEPSFGDSSMEGADLSLLGDTRGLVFSMHDYYAGGPAAGYAHGGERVSPGQGGVITAEGGGYPPPSPAVLERHFRVNYDLMQRAGIPTWIGEFGIAVHERAARAWIRAKVALYERFGVGHAWWLYDAAGANAPLDRATGRFRPWVRLLRP